ncbi:hypothetical protein ACWDX6_20380 [Streptomyces sp. NPDC003027]
MITFDYVLENRPDPVGWEHRLDCKEASRRDILWYFFPGDVRIDVNGVDFTTHFGWVPVLHFGLSLVAITESLSESAKSNSEYSFTEADEVISFARTGGMVSVEWSLTPGSARCSFSELRLAVKQFVERIVAELGVGFPSFLDNPVSEEMLRRASRP